MPSSGRVYITMICGAGCDVTIVEVGVLLFKLCLGDVYMLNIRSYSDDRIQMIS